MAPRKVRLGPLLAGVALLFLSGCSRGGGGGSSYGLVRREVVQGLTFPTGLPQPGPVQAIVAFPSLTFARPLFLTAPPDGSNRVVVVEQDGLVHIFPNSAATTTTRVFLDLRGVVRRVGFEEGLLGLAFDPSYATNGRFYVNYIASNPPRTVVSRWTVSSDPDRADPGSEQVLVTFNQPYENHNGGMLAFGPDGMLYISSGDGGSGNDPQNNAQNLGNLLGKILRIAPDGSVPSDNPYVGGTNGERPEIWAHGLRNPWRISFDRATGTLWAGDVGQGAFEEVDIIRRGGNYGWRVYEGNRSNLNPTAIPPSAFDAPVHAYPRSQGTSVTGGYVYRGPSVLSLTGAYIYADFGNGTVWALVHDGQRMVSNTAIATITNPTSFGEDAAGELYVCSFDGRIYRFQPNGGGGGPFPRTLSATGLFRDVASLAPTPGLIEYEVNAPLWSDGARKRRWLALPSTSQIGFHPTEAFDFAVGTVLVKHFEIDVAPGLTKRLETRVLLRHDTGWQGYTYRWNSSGTDADLLDDAADETFTIQDGSGSRQQTWHYPSRAECLLCHTAAAGRVLGVRTRQLNRSFPYPALRDNQLRAWNHIALFAADIGAHDQYEALPDPADPLRTYSERARAYLDANCANCHRPGGPTPVDLDLRYGIDRLLLNALGVVPVNPVGGDPNRRRILEGSKELSDVWERLRRRDLWVMPPLSTTVPDGVAADLIGLWIDGGAR
jgi:uncharacterized repeat protein (TIGR03806 family)